MSEITLFPHQKEAVEKIVNVLKSEYSFLLADAPRVGKTYTALEVARQMNFQNVLVLCPSSIVLQWQREAAKFGITPTVFSYDKFANRIKEQIRLQYDFIILDEAHYLKNRDTKRYKAVSGFLVTQKRAKLLALTGTPFQNGPLEFQNLLILLKRGKFSFAGHVYSQTFQIKAITVKKYYWILDSLEELGEKLRAQGWYLRRVFADVAKDVPPFVRNVVYLPSDEFEKELEKIDNILYDLIDKARAAGFEDKAQRLQSILDRNFTLDSLISSWGDLASVRRIIAVSKAKQVAQYILDIFESDKDERVICFAHHLELSDKIRDTLRKNNLRVATIKGTDDAKERQSRIDKFQQGEIDVLLIGIRTGNAGITLDNATRVIFAELDWNPAILSQAENRAISVHTRHQVLIEYLVLDFWLEDKFMKMLSNKATAAIKVYAQQHEMPFGENVLY